MVILWTSASAGVLFLLYVILHILRDIIKCAKNGIKHCRTIISEKHSFHFVKFPTESIILLCNGKK